MRWRIRLFSGWDPGLAPAACRRLGLPPEAVNWGQSLLERVDLFRQLRQSSSAPLAYLAYAFSDAPALAAADVVLSLDDGTVPFTSLLADLVIPTQHFDRLVACIRLARRARRRHKINMGLVAGPHVLSARSQRRSGPALAPRIRMAGVQLPRGPAMNLPRGSLVLVDLEPTRGHEQRGTRPFLVVSDPAVNASQRFPLLAVVPITETPAPGALYPPLAPGANGLTKPSYALVDQLRSIDKQRIRRRYGQVRGEELAAIDAGLCLYLGLVLDPG